MICSESYLTLCNSILTISSFQIKNVFIFSENALQTELDSLTAKMIKTTNERKFFVIASANISQLFVNSLINKKVFGEGTGIVVYGESITYLNKTGILAVVETGLEQIKSLNDYRMTPILSLLSYLQTTSQKISNKSLVFQQISNYF